MKSWSVVASALAAASALAGEAPGEHARVREPVVEPEKIDVVYERLGVQRRTLEAVVKIVTQLEAVADQSDAAAALLSDQGDPTERLKRALDAVSERRGRLGNGAGTPVVVEAQTAASSGDALRANDEPRRTVEVVYAERGGAAPGRVVVADRGSYYAASVGQRVLVGQDMVEVVRIVEDAHDELTVVLRINGDAAVDRRVRR